MRQYATLFDSSTGLTSIIFKDQNDTGWSIYLKDAGSRAEEIVAAFTSQDGSDDHDRVD
jgi:hypothetical protein